MRLPTLTAPSSSTLAFARIQPRGFVYMSKGEYDRAFAEYTHALELDPRFAKAV